MVGPVGTAPGWEEGTLAWAKIRGHPIWPGQVIRASFAPPNVQRLKEPGTVLLTFFGDGSFGWYPPAQLVHFYDKMDEKLKVAFSHKNKSYRKAAEEAKEVWDRRRGITPATSHRPLDLRDPSTWHPQWRGIQVPPAPSVAALATCTAADARKWLFELATHPTDPSKMNGDFAKTAAGLCWMTAYNKRTLLSSVVEQALADHPGKSSQPAPAGSSAKPAPSGPPQPPPQASKKRPPGQQKTPAEKRAESGSDDEEESEEAEEHEHSSEEEDSDDSDTKPRKKQAVGKSKPQAKGPGKPPAKQRLQKLDSMPRPGQLSRPALPPQPPPAKGPPQPPPPADGARPVRSKTKSLLAFVNPIVEETYMDEDREVTGALPPPPTFPAPRTNEQTRYWGPMGATKAAQNLPDPDDQQKLLHGGTLEIDLPDMLSWLHDLASNPVVTREESLPIMIAQEAMAVLRHKEITQKRSCLNKYGEVGILARSTMEALDSGFTIPVESWPIPPQANAPPPLLTRNLLRLLKGGSPVDRAFAHAGGPTGRPAQPGRVRSLHYDEDRAHEDEEPSEDEEDEFVAGQESSDDANDIDFSDEERVGGKRGRGKRSAASSPQSAKRAKSSKARVKEEGGLDSTEPLETEKVEVELKEYTDRVPPNDAAFQAAYQRWQAERGREGAVHPTMIGPYTWKPYDLFQLVAQEGGCEAVTAAGKWHLTTEAWIKRQADARAAAGGVVPPMNTQTSNNMRKALENHYRQLLLPFENFMTSHPSKCNITKQIVDKLDEKGHLVYVKREPAMAEDEEDEEMGGYAGVLAAHVKAKKAAMAREQRKAHGKYDLDVFDDLAEGRKDAGHGSQHNVKLDRNGSGSAKLDRQSSGGGGSQAGGNKRSAVLPGKGGLFDNISPRSRDRERDVDADMRRLLIRFPEGTPMINPTRAHFHLSKHIPSLKKSEVKINEQRCMIVADCRTPQEARVVSEKLKRIGFNLIPELRLDRSAVISVSIVRADEKPPVRTTQLPRPFETSYEGRHSPYDNLPPPPQHERPSLPPHPHAVPSSHGPLPPPPPAVPLTSVLDNTSVPQTLHAPPTLAVPPAIPLPSATPVDPRRANQQPSAAPAALPPPPGGLYGAPGTQTAPPLGILLGAARPPMPTSQPTPDVSTQAIQQLLKSLQEPQAAAALSAVTGSAAAAPPAQQPPGPPSQQQAAGMALLQNMGLLQQQQQTQQQPNPPPGFPTANGPVNAAAASDANAILQALLQTLAPQ